MTDHAAAQTAVSTEQEVSLSAEQKRQIAMARKRARKVRRAAGVATFDAWVTGVLAAFTLSYAAISPAMGGLSWPAVAIGVAMTAVAYNSFRGASRLRRYDVRAPRLLALNQIAFSAVIVAYCLWQIVSVLAGRSVLVNLLDDYIRTTGGRIPFDLEYFVAFAYAIVICGSILTQGGTALYYLIRGRYVREFRRQTPQWVVDLLTTGIR